MLKWCRRAGEYGRPHNGMIIWCYNWVCVCGEIADRHFLEPHGGVSIACSITGCKRFIFKNNSKCELECMLKYLIEKYGK